MKPNIRLSLFRLIPVSLLALLRNVVSKLTGNPALPTPPVTLIAMTAAGDALQLAIDNAQFGSRHDREVRDTAVVKVRSMLTQIGNYVRTTANGDAVILASSGFAMAKTPEPIGLPAAPDGLKVLMGPLSGQNEAKWRRSKGALSYRLQQSDKDPAVLANWQTVAITASVRHIVQGLEPFKPYWYCVSAIGFAGEGNPCAPIMGRSA